MIPAFPAFVLLVAALPFLWPGLERRTASDGDVVSRRSARLLPVALVAGVLVTAVVPFAAIAAGTPEGGSSVHAVELGYSQGPSPLGVDVGLTARASGGRVVLSWRPQSTAGGPVFYHVFRNAASDADYMCDPSTVVQRCLFQMQDVVATRDTSFVDRPGPGRWAYRIGLAANWLDDPTLGDVYVVSSRVVATRP
jgi:hypothetical protein